MDFGLCKWGLLYMCIHIIMYLLVCGIPQNVLPFPIWEQVLGSLYTSWCSYDSVPHAWWSYLLQSPACWKIAMSLLLVVQIPSVSRYFLFFNHFCPLPLHACHAARCLHWSRAPPPLPPENTLIEGKTERTVSILALRVCPFLLIIGHATQKQNRKWTGLYC